MSYSQRDPAWAGEALGWGPDSIGADGCYITSHADLMTWAGHPMNPHDMNEAIKGANLFVNCGEGSIECLPGDDRILEMLWPNLWKLEEVYHCEGVRCDQNKLNNDDPNIYVEVMLSGGGLGSGTHFSPIVNWRGWTIADAWVGFERPISAWGGDPASLISKAIRYRYIGGGGGPAPVPPTPVPPGSFAGQVMADSGGWTHSDPSTATTTRKRLIAKGGTLTFDRYCHAESVTDVTSGQPDDRWFHISDGSDEWIASAVIKGNPGGDVPVVPPPGSAATTFTVQASGGAHIRVAPDLTAATKRDVADAGETLSVAVSTHGGAGIPDNWNGKPTNEWFGLVEGGWLASAVAKGEPPAGWQHEVPYPISPTPPPSPTPGPPPPYVGDSDALRGAWVWEWEEAADYAKLKSFGYRGVLIRAANGDGGANDARFNANWHARSAAARAAGLEVCCWTYWYGPGDAGYAEPDAAAYHMREALHTVGLGFDTPAWVVDYESRDDTGLSTALKLLHDRSGRAVLLAPPGDPNEYGMNWNWTAMDGSVDGYVPQVYTAAWQGRPSEAQAFSEWGRRKPLYPASDEQDPAAAKTWQALLPAVNGWSYWRSGVGTDDSLRSYAPGPSGPPSPPPVPIPVPIPVPVPVPNPVPSPIPPPGPPSLADALRAFFDWLFRRAPH